MDWTLENIHMGGEDLQVKTLRRSSSPSLEVEDCVKCKNGPWKEPEDEEHHVLDGEIYKTVVMASVRNWWSHSRPAVLIWVLSFLLFYWFLQMALQNSSRPISSTPDIPVSNTEQRLRLYAKMAKDLDENGPVFLKHGETSQSLTLSELFTLESGSIKPALKAANPPVRANVLHMSLKYSEPISEAVREIFHPYFEKAIWFQNSTLYHFSMFHASHHITPVPASEDEIGQEANAVRTVADSSCPLRIILDRVVLTSTGVLLGCWQVYSGTDPITIRAKLRAALPRAPEKQLYDAAILHTSFARLLGPPKASSMVLHQTSDQLQLFHQLVTRLNERIRGYKATVLELWFVEEYDLLALAFNGRMKIRRFQLGCRGGA